MADTSNSVISIDKAKTCISGYVWNSPCLKMFFYNPFLVATIILGIIWASDFIYGKRFYNGCGISNHVQHIIFTYLIVATSICMNNMMISHHFRMDKYEKKSEPEEAIEESTYTTEYIE